MKVNVDPENSKCATLPSPVNMYYPVDLAMRSQVLLLSQMLCKNFTDSDYLLQPKVPKRGYFPG
jgi:hypothetical protein